MVVASLWERRLSAGVFFFFCAHILLPPLYITACECSLRVDALHPPFVMFLTPSSSTRAAAAAAAGFHRVTQVSCDLIISQSVWNAQISWDYLTIETTGTIFSSNGSTHFAFTPTQLIPKSWMSDFPEKILFKAASCVEIRADVSQQGLSAIAANSLFRRHPLKDSHPDDDF